ncbi:hypothetical protein [Hyalangium versicolor]|uniref:hypothetical protein n=1 Tax=Hyalangium versicolor TaxID=2861190 RepID=UPI001CCB3E94|nr:hypothetical protein [Hyalangium versicolor]
MKELQGPRAQLGRFEQFVRSELGPLVAGAEPLLTDVREGIAAIFPEAGGTRLAPKEHEARHEKLVASMDELEDVLEALQLAARSGHSAAGKARGGG